MVADDDGGVVDEMLLGDVDVGVIVDDGEAGGSLGLMDCRSRGGGVAG